jgi:predicted transcriptional regulator
MPVLGGCGISYFASCWLMRNTILTEKIARRGVRVPAEYGEDFLDRIAVADIASEAVVALAADDTVEDLRTWLSSGRVEAHHGGFPVIDSSQNLIGLVGRADILDPARDPKSRAADIAKRPPAIIFEDCTVREAADHMINEGVGRLPVVSRDAPLKVKGIVSRSDVLSAHRRRLEEAHRSHRHLQLRVIQFGRTQT